MGYTADEMMAVAAARFVRDGQICFVGIGLPGKALILAKQLYAPDAVLVYESGVLDTNPAVEPLSIGDGELAETAQAIVSLPEMFNYWLQGGWIDLAFLGAAQIDRFGNINTTVIGSYDAPKVRLPGAGGAPEIASSAAETLVMVRQNTRAFVETVDFVTTVGHPNGGSGSRADLGLRGAGPTHIVTDLGELTFDHGRGEFVQTGLYEGVDAVTAMERTGWELAISENLRGIPPPSDEELRALRQIARG